MNQRFGRELRGPNGSWRVDEAYGKAAGNWAYLYRAVDSARGAIEFMLWPERDLVWSGKSNERLRWADAGTANESRLLKPACGVTVSQLLRAMVASLSKTGWTSHVAACFGGSYETSRQLHAARAVRDFLHAYHPEVLVGCLSPGGVVRNRALAKPNHAIHTGLFDTARISLVVGIEIR